MTSILSFILTILAKAYLWRYRPRIIAVTGNSGKTTTKEMIATVLTARYRVRATGGNLNNHLGTPTTIIGDFSSAYYRSGGTLLFWIGVIVHGLFGLIANPEYPEILILEYGADKPGDIKRLARRFRPHVGVITHIGETPVHVEFFASAQHLADEKSQLIRALLPDGHAVLNYDDLTVLSMRDRSAAPTITFGLGEGADARAVDIRTRMDGQKPFGLTFNLVHGGASMPTVIPRTLGKGAATAAAAALAVAHIFEVGLADVCEAISRAKSPAGRMSIIPGIKETTIIDDTYNASPAAMHLALDTVKDLPGRKVLVLGDMLELGAQTVHAHQSIGNMAGDIADVLICVGERGRHIADAAANQLPQESIHWFADSRSAAGKVQELLRSGDLVLVKASQGMRMERIVREIMAEPARASELLVRQSVLWLRK
jgi:UDP-N-acetylmuramyl pentapeptide synthase